MGGERTKTQTSGTQQQSAQYTPTAEETELNKLDLANRRELNPQLLDVQKQGLEVSSQLLRGQALPGYLQGLPGGISPQVTQSLVDRSIRDIQPNMQLSGLLDSGVNASISARSSADIRNQSEQFNLQNLMQLLNVGVGGQAQVQAPIEGFGAQLSNRLSGLRNISQSGSGSSISNTNVFTKTNMMNDMMKAGGQAAATKSAMMCIPEGVLIDTPTGSSKIEDLKAGDKILDKEGNESVVLMKYDFLETPTDDRFIEIKFSNDSVIQLCDLHELDGVASKDLEVGSFVRDNEVVSKKFISFAGRSFDLMTQSESYGYRINGIAIDTMIPKLHELTNKLLEA